MAHGTAKRPIPGFSGGTVGTGAFMLGTGPTTTSPTINTSILGTALLIPPQGRLTLTSNVPVLTSDVAETGTIYYTPYVGDRIPIHSGSGVWTIRTFTQLQLDLDAADHLANKNFDIFVWMDSSTMRLGTTAAWSSDTARSVAISMQNGLYVNTGITTLYSGGTDYASVAAGTATYVGTIRTTTTNAKTIMQFLPAAATGQATSLAKLFVWNAYNTKTVTAAVIDSADNWTQSGTSVWEAWNKAGANAGVQNSVSFVVGLDGQFIAADVHGWAYNGSANRREVVGIGYDSLTALSAGCINGIWYGAQYYTSLSANLRRPTTMGYHYVQALNWCDASGGNIYYGDDGMANVPHSCGLVASLEM